MNSSIVIVLIAGVLVGATLWMRAMVRRKQMSEWLWSFCKQQMKRSYRPLSGEVTHVLFCFVDHFEPLAGPTKEAERERMKAWVEGYPRLAGSHKDSTGRPPQHTWFYPGESYDAECLDGLGVLVRGGYGEVELHLHHGYDIPERLRAKLESALVNFSKHGALVVERNSPRYAFGFIHGNMSLNNSNDIAYCGVNNELRILKEAGCYADFSMPTAPCKSQTRKINAIYYAADIPGKPKSHDDGVEVEVGGKPSGDLMIIQGPLGVNWRNRKYGILSRIENGEIQGSNPATFSRIKSWVSQHIHVKGRPEWVIVKVSCHGAEDRSREVLLGKPADQMYSSLEREYRDRPRYCLHYVTARELYNIIKAAEAGEKGSPEAYRDYVIPPYRNHQAGRHGH